MTILMTMLMTMLLMTNVVDDNVVDDDDHDVIDDRLALYVSDCTTFCLHYIVLYNRGFYCIFSKRFNEQGIIKHNSDHFANFSM